MYRDRKSGLTTPGGVVVGVARGCGFGVGVVGASLAHVLAVLENQRVVPAVRLVSAARPLLIMMEIGFMGDIVYFLSSVQLWSVLLQHHPGSQSAGGD